MWLSIKTWIQCDWNCSCSRADNFDMRLANVCQSWSPAVASVTLKCHFSQPSILNLIEDEWSYSPVRAKRSRKQCAFPREKQQLAYSSSLVGCYNIKNQVLWMTFKRAEMSTWNGQCWIDNILTANFQHNVVKIVHLSFPHLASLVLESFWLLSKDAEKRCPIKIDTKTASPIPNQVSLID